MLNFVKYDHVTFCTLFYLCGKSYIYIYFNVETSFYPRDKSHLVMVYNPFSVLWTQFDSVLLRIFTSIFIRDTGL